LFKLNKEIDPEANANQDEAAAHLLGGQNEDHMEHPAGVILESEADRLRRLVFRITKGKGQVFLSDAFEQEDVKKIVFMVVALGNPAIKASVKKVCDSFLGTNVEVPHQNNIPLKVRQHYE